MKKVILLITAIMILVLPITLVHAKSDMNNTGISNSEESAYGSYYDESLSKADVKTFKYGSTSKNLHYTKTENLNDLSVDKRSDAYGTYDVYNDDSQTEYLFLHNSDLLCGFKFSEIGKPETKEYAVSEEHVKDIADKFLQTWIPSNNGYIMFSCVYDNLSGIYDVQYYMPINNYKSDDIVRIWVNTSGEVTAFSAFNLNRYTDVSVTDSLLETATDKIVDKINSSIGNVFTVVDSYITKDDSGNIILAYIVDYKVSFDDNYSTIRDSFTQQIN